VAARRLLVPFVLALLALPSSAAAVVQGTPGRIAFTSGRDGNYEISTAWPDGSEPTRLTDNPADDQSPAFSPDATRVAFTSFRDGAEAIYVMNADGSSQTRVSPELNGPTQDSVPEWSPDGTQLVFASTRPFGDAWAIWAMNADGSNLHRVTRDFGYSPSWSPDGTEIAYVGPGESIWVVNADGWDPHRVTFSGLPEGDPAWSPSGRQLVIGRYRDDWQTSNARNLFIVDSRGSWEVQLTSGGAFDANASWAPDGSRIVFQRHQGVFGSSRELYTVESGGGVPVQVTTDGGNGEPDWGVFFLPPPPPPPPPGDTTRPTITIASPTSGAYVLGSSTYADFTCRDDRDGPDAIALCEASVRWPGGEVTLHSGDPLPTAPVGPRTLFVLARDRAGNETGESRVYDIVYDFSGFGNPLQPFPHEASFKAGDGIPVRFSLAGGHGLDVLMDWAPVSREVPCGDAPAGPWGTQTGGTLSYKASQDRYTYLWRTEKAWAGTCRQLVVVLNDGTYHHANVRFAK
jgi:Tol biopolymer transport system component